MCLVISNSVENKESRHFHVTNYYGIESNVLLEIKGVNLFYGSLVTFGNIKESQYGGSIYVEPANHTLVLEDVIIKNNTAVYGGGIYTAGNVILKNSKVVNNVAIKQGGGIWAYGSVTMYDSYVDYNSVSEIATANFGGGIIINDGDLVMQNSSVSFNNVNYSEDQNSPIPNPFGGSVGGVNVMNGSIYASNSNINNNSAFSSGGIEMGVGNVNILSNSSVSYNKSYAAGEATGGGGIVITLGNVVVQDSEVSHNDTNGMFSGSIVSFVGNVSVLNSEICYNTNRGPGGGIASNFNSTITVSDSKINNNTGASLGGAIVNFSGPLGQIFINNSDISNNEITNYQRIGQTILAFLKVILGSVDKSNLMIKSIPNPDNTGSKKLINALEMLQARALDTQAKLNTIKLIDLFATGGGAIATLLPCPIVVTKSRLTNNCATKRVTDLNPLFTGYGGAIFSVNSSVSVQDSEILSNTAITGASAIFSNHTLIIQDSVVSKNKLDNQINQINQDNQDNQINQDNQNNQDKKTGTIYNGAKGSLNIISSDVEFNKGGGIYTNSNFVDIDSKIKNNKPYNVIIY